MKITYDQEADAIYILLANRKPSHAIEVEEGINYDVDEQGHLIGIEILDASTRYKDFNKVEFIHYSLPLKKKTKKRIQKKEATTA